MNNDVIWFSQLSKEDVPQVGGKNASLGEMISNLAHMGVQVPDGFATTAHAFHEFLNETGLSTEIAALLADLKVDNVKQLAEVGRTIREKIIAAPMPAKLEKESNKAPINNKCFISLLL